MERFDNPLRHVRVAAPCTADWERMRGDERVRFCEQCSLNVYNLSGMTRREAQTLLSSAEGRLCVRYYRRRDGTILTNNCPVGLRALKRRVSRVAGAALSAVVSFFAGLGVVSGLDSHRSPIMGDTVGTLEADGERAMMGARAVEPVAAMQSGPAAMGEAASDENGWMEGRAFIPPRNSRRERPRHR